MDHLREINRILKDWREHILPAVTIEFGMAICEELERCEPFQYTKSIYDKEYERCLLMRKLYEEACVMYPMAMGIAKEKFFAKRLNDLKLVSGA